MGDHQIHFLVVGDRFVQLREMQDVAKLPYVIWSIVSMTN